MSFFSQKPEGFGLDIADSSLKIAMLEKQGKDLRLICFGEEKIPSGVVNGGEIKKENVLADLVKQTLTKVKGRKLTTKYVTASLPEDKSFLDILQIPLVSQEDLASTVRFEAANHIPFPLEDVYFDFERLPSLPAVKQHNQQQVLVAATPKKIVDGYARTLKMAGLQPLAFETESLAIARALIKKDKHQPPLLIIDFGESRASFLIFAERAVQFSSTISVSAGGLTRAIAKVVKVSEKKAEVLKLKEGLSGKRKVFQSMLPVLTALVQEVKMHLEYYHSHAVQSHLKKTQVLEKVLLCGGGASLKGLADFLAAELKIAVELGNPFVNISRGSLKGGTDISFKTSLGYTTVLGLALKAYDY